MIKKGADYSVIICTYNGAKYIKEQLNSILQQTILPAKIIIYDDASLDNTIEICIQTFKQSSYSQYEIINTRSGGACLNFLTAIMHYENSTSYLFLADQDDVWIREKAEKQISAQCVNPNENSFLCYSSSTIVDEKLNIISLDFYSFQGISRDVLEDDSIFFQNCVQGATIMLSRKGVSNIKDVTVHANMNNVVMHDWWATLVIKYLDGELFFINESLIYYRQHRKNQIGAKVNNKFNFLLHPYLYFNSMCKLLKQCNEFNEALACFESKKVDFTICVTDSGFRKLENKKLKIDKLKFIKRIIVKSFYFFKWKN